MILKKRDEKMIPKKKEKYEGIGILIIFIGLLAIIGFTLFNHATNGILFADVIECPEGKYKIIATDFKPSDDSWQIQPDRSYAKCIDYISDKNYINIDGEFDIYSDDLNSIGMAENLTCSQIPTNQTACKIVFTIDP